LPALLGLSRHVTPAAAEQEKSNVPTIAGQNVGRLRF
jgi:hypothetical protein